MIHLRRESAQLTIENILVNIGAITQEELSAATEKYALKHNKLCEKLVKDGIITEHSYVDALSIQSGKRSVCLSQIRPYDGALSLVDKGVAERLNLIPIDIAENGNLVVAMADPNDISAIGDLRPVVKRNIEVCVAGRTEIRDAISREYNALNTGKTSEHINENDAQDDVNSAINLVNSILDQAIRDGASDVHIEPSATVMRVRMRIDGKLYITQEITMEAQPAVISRIKVLASMDIAEKRRPQDGHIKETYGGRLIDLRISTLPTIFGEKAVLRLLDSSVGRLGTESLGFGAEQMTMLRNAISAPDGIILVTGPTGSGKSTTLYSMLGILKDPTKNIVTIEDPVEYTIDGVAQVQINEHIGITFGSMLRSILRQDPDIIMVGEIRDTETTELAIRAALTGHLVLSTLHTNDATSAVSRLVDMGAKRFLLAPTLRAVTAQRLVRVLCPACKQKIAVNAELSEATGIERGSIVYAPTGCPECGNKGYRGRTAIAEVMLVDNTIRGMIADGAPKSDLREYARSIGMITLREDARRKVEEGVTSIEEMLSVTVKD